MTPRVVADRRTAVLIHASDHAGTTTSLTEELCLARGRPRDLGVAGRWARWMVLPVLFVAAGACYDEPSVVVAPVRVGEPSAAMKAADPAGDSWNRLEVDVFVAVDGVTSKAMASMKVSRGFAYHMTKRKDEAGRWVTDMDLGEYRPRTSSPLPEVGSPPITRISGASRTSAPQYSDANGQLRVMPTLPNGPRVMDDGKARPDTRGQGQRPVLPTLPARALQLPSDTSRAWADAFLVTVTSAARVRAALISRADAIQSAGGKSRFVRSSQGRTTEIILDDASGQIREMRALAGGKLEATTTRDYAEIAGGVHVLLSERTTRYSSHEGVAPMVITTIYRNLRVLEDR